MNQQRHNRPQRDLEAFSSVRSTSSNLGAMNVVNCLAYCANAFAFYGVGMFGLFGLATTDQVSATFQTLATPALWTFLIWVFIFTFQFAWAIAQLLQDFRTMPLVQSVSWNYVAVCVCQIGWTISYCLATQESVCLSMVAMVGILFFLFRIFSAQSNVHARSYLYWVLKFPWCLYYGWIIAAAVFNLNVLLVAVGVADNVQFYVALASVSSLMLVSCATSDSAVLLVLAWATVRVCDCVKSSF